MFRCDFVLVKLVNLKIPMNKNRSKTLSPLTEFFRLSTIFLRCSNSQFRIYLTYDPATTQKKSMPSMSSRVPIVMQNTVSVSFSTPQMSKMQFEERKPFFAKPLELIVTHPICNRPGNGWIKITKKTVFLGVEFNHVFVWIRICILKWF